MIGPTKAFKISGSRNVVNGTLVYLISFSVVLVCFVGLYRGT